ncbi:MAG TPA: hypothetical protein VKT78_07095 [Fimbriimonadaceae bacterium]|nr:hypothetical protein [Fimbriimonadaceae bacterium]
MSTTIEGIDARGYLIGWAKAVTGMTVADIKAIPDEKWTATFGGCTRPCNELTADTISLLNWVTGELTGTKSGGDYMETMKQLAADVSTKGAAIAKFTESVDNLAAALAGATDERLNSMVTPPWQMETPLYMVALIAVSHIWYHDGQFNYVHCLLGDNKVHWMGEG